jgi:hypothetical protein
VNTKYEFVPGDAIVIAPGRMLRRIRALVAIAAFGVCPRDLGGYIEKEDCLEVSGNAWVSGNARVSGNAWVSGTAWVYGSAEVYGDAWVYGNARVSGNAWVYGNAQVSGNAQVYGSAEVYGDAQVSGNAQVYGTGLIFLASNVGTENGTLTVYNTKENTLEVTRGCFRGTIDAFLAASEAKHDDATHLEYRLLIEVAHSRINRARKTSDFKEARP